MKRIILIIGLVLLLAVQSWGDGVELEIESHDSGYRYFTADETYMYFMKPAVNNKLWKRDTNGVEVEGYNFSSLAASNIYFIYAVGDGTVLAVLDDADDKYRVYRSTDYGDTFNTTHVLLLGDTDGTVGNQISNVRVLGDRGFCVADIDGTETLLIAEYNINASNSGASADTWEATDQALLIKSEDDGATWSEVAEWNTDGSAVDIRHFHVIAQHPTSGDIYISTGDAATADMAGIIRWDGTTSLPDNRTGSEYSDNFDSNGYSGVDGQQRYRAADFIFGSDGIYLFPDTTSPDSERGIFFLSNDLTACYRINNDVLDYTDHAGMYGLKVSGNNFIYVNLIEDNNDDMGYFFYTSNDAGKHWEVTARASVTATAATAGSILPMSLFSWNGKVYLSYRNCAREDDDVGIVINVEGDFDDRYLTILYPTYYITSTGSNLNDGDTLDEAWGTLEYALEVDRVGPGSRVLLGAGTFAEKGIWLDWNAPTNPSNGYVVVEGAGMDLTDITHDGTTAYHFYIESAEPIIFHKIDANPYDTTDVIFNIQANADIKIFESRIGDTITANGGNIRCQGGVTLDLKYSVIQDVLTSSQELIETAGAGSTLNIERNVLIGGNQHVYHDNNSTVNFYHNVCLNYNASCIYTAAGASLVNAKNNIFSSPGEYALSDDASLTETDSVLDYNIYIDGVAWMRNISNIGGTNSLFSDPNLTSEYKIPSGGFGEDSGVTVSGVNDANQTDPDGNVTYGAPDIGIYERKISSGGSNIISIGGGFGIQ